MNEYDVTEIELKNGMRVMVVDSTDPENVKRYLDSCIAKWRMVQTNEMSEHWAKAGIYVDAFQSVRMSLFGEVLP